MKTKVSKNEKNLFLFLPLIRFLEILKRDLRRSCEFIRTRYCEFIRSNRTTTERFQTSPLFQYVIFIIYQLLFII